MTIENTSEGYGPVDQFVRCIVSCILNLLPGYKFPLDMRVYRRFLSDNLRKVGTPHETAAITRFTR